MNTPLPAPASSYTISLSRIKDLPGHRRPRELALEVGVENVPDEVLLAILLRSGISGQSVIDLARQLLDAYQGSLAQLATARQEELLELGIKGLGNVKRLELRAAFELGRRARKEAAVPQRLIREPVHVLAELESQTAHLDQETIWVLPLDQKYRLRRAPIEITKGILNASLSHPREIFREAIRMAAAAVIIAHNHPSGDPTPSAEDLATTRQLVATGNVVGIQVLDHIIIGGNHPPPPPYTSLRESGLVDFS
ncbi:MAG: DNA repair protein RadC [Kiritimatiellae bacterium]|jgi:DNA repair protein RadC|nr:DNA repair protein RadC [Kiritimatiellia bacterium]MDD4341791.1 DNA repair protein RadC [Kiritimatiellia bacterium]MDY0148719.1 DNA repair protein RadC [Kiritimatiellia bacterium]